MAMSDPGVTEMPGEVGAELAAVIGLDSLNRHRQLPANLINERDRVGDRGPGVNRQYSVPGRLVNGGELIEPAGAEFQVLDVHLDGLAAWASSRRRRGPGGSAGRRRAAPGWGRTGAHGGP